MNEKEKLLKSMAQKYAESYGNELKTELLRLEESGAPYPTKGLEKRVMKSVHPQKRRYMRFAAVAAALVLIIVGLGILRPFSGGEQNSLSEAPSESYEAIPLSFSVPVGFAKAGFEQDREKSVYYFSDSLEDDVVLTMEKSTKKPDTEGLTKISINGEDAFAASEEGYNLLTFQKDGVLYELTCRYDVNTLLFFGIEIL